MQKSTWFIINSTLKLVNIKLIPQVLEKLWLNELKISSPWFESLIGSAVAGINLLPRNFFIYPCKSNEYIPKV